MHDLEKLKSMIDEDNYPYFDVATLQEMLYNANREGRSIESLARELCLKKAGIEGIKLGDISIPSPREHFMALANKYRANCNGIKVRADGR